MSDQNAEEKASKSDKLIEVIVEHLKPGTVLTSPTYDAVGNAIHGGYIPFTENEIDALLAAGIEKIYYTPPGDSSIKIQSKNGKSKLLSYIQNNEYEGPRTISTDSQSKAVCIMEKMFQVIKDDLDEAEIYKEARSIIEQLLSEIDNRDHEIVNLLDIQEYDDYTYTHSLNVGVISLLFARKLNLDDEMVKNIGLGGFLHDIGKVKVPTELINKRGKLSADEFEQVKHHAQIGYETIKDNANLHDVAKNCILLHHEKYDGSGYPLGLKEDQIEDHVAVVALADYYDALTTERSYKKAFTARETFNLIMKKAGVYFKTEMALRFVNDMISLFKESDFLAIGVYVLLNTKEIAKVVSKDTELTSRPGVEIIKTKEGKVLAKPIYVDLNGDSTRHIISILDKTIIEKDK